MSTKEMSPSYWPEGQLWDDLLHDDRSGRQSTLDGSTLVQISWKVEERWLHMSLRASQ